MKNYRLIFWISTGLFSAFMLFSGYSYLTSEEMKQAFVHIGFASSNRGVVIVQYLSFFLFLIHKCPAAFLIGTNRFLICLGSYCFRPALADA